MKYEGDCGSDSPCTHTQEQFRRGGWGRGERAETEQEKPCSLINPWAGKLFAFLRYFLFHSAPTLLSFQEIQYQDTRRYCCVKSTPLSLLREGMRGTHE
ncbi:hypothetical protein JTE90_000287 [Oedothorax gibbosus]|uniref:Uncharacterized protein n=1 Tax=Oedothorax gibbosus TaxID=931172 RepID=A0AAV6VUP7_9ARAC|nr:hypothetical protein JTE90_000287 [Oedothorax gibbosus]